MKKVFISIGLIINSLQVTTAQIQKGSWMLDGGLHCNQQNIYGENSDWGRASQYKRNVSDVLLSGTVGYFGSNKVAFGGSAAFGRLNITSLYTTASNFQRREQRFQTHQVAPFVRYYFTPQS